jgi:hypothetical protein
MHTTVVEGCSGCNWMNKTEPTPGATYWSPEDNRNEVIAKIKAAFKARGLRYSVTGGRGTAWGWITIDLLPSVHKDLMHLDPVYRERAYLKLGADLGKEKGYTSESIPASSDYYREYIDRANGRTPSVIGEPYWD